MALRIVKINASTAIEVIDLTAPVTVEVSIERDSRAFDAGQRGVEFPLAYQERVVLSAELGGILSLEPTARRRNDFRTQAERGQRRKALIYDLVKRCCAINKNVGDFWK
jgi:hypothetical protein